MNIEKPLKTSILFGILFFLFLGVSKNSKAQENDTIIPINKKPEKILRKIDTRQITQNGFNFWQDDFSGHLAGIDFGFNLFLNKDYTGFNSEFMDNDVFRSNSAYIHIIQQSIGLQRNRNTVGLVSGIGLHLESYRLDKNTTIRRGLNDVIEPEILYFDQNQKSKLSIASLMVPILAEFQLPINRYENRLYVSSGIFMSYRISSHTKIKYRIDRKKEKLKVPDFLSLNDYKYGLMFRAGYRWINIFATYDLVPLFRENKGPELIPFTFGFTLVSF